MSTINKSALTDHATTENHTIDWEGVNIVDKEPNRRIRHIKEAIWIRKTTTSINRDEGNYELPHVYDDVMKRHSTMDLYDEDLSENKFFRSLADKFPNLFDVATCNRCTICVPCMGSLVGYNFSKENIDSHVLVPVEEKPCCFVTVNGRELTIHSNIVTCGNGFTHTDPIPVLFEETFFNANDESYMVLCIAQPLDGVSSVSDSQSKGFILSSFTDYTSFLWGEAGMSSSNIILQITENCTYVIDLMSCMYNSREILAMLTVVLPQVEKKNKKLVDQAVSSFLGHFHRLERASLTKHIDAATDLFTKAMQIVLKNRHLKKPASDDSVLMENIKVAVEAYVLHCIYKPPIHGIRYVGLYSTPTAPSGTIVTPAPVPGPDAVDDIDSLTATTRTGSLTFLSDKTLYCCKTLGKKLQALDDEMTTILDR
ncbi:Ankyrin repeat domain-containing protein 27 [Lamellibrachia satsuma]|nr:Ankyrin repeat domain-containing protein 27 [Lamellibrachia satsuma]